MERDGKKCQAGLSIPDFQSSSSPEGKWLSAKKDRWAAPEAKTFTKLLTADATRSRARQSRPMMRRANQFIES